MTAVASPPSLQALPRLGWTGNDSQGMASMTAEMFMPRRAPQRVNSASSITSNGSASSTGTTVAISNQASANGVLANGHLDSWTSLKKVPRGFSNSAKAEPPPTQPDGRLPPLPTSQPGQIANGNPAPIVHQPSPLLPTQNVTQVIQQSNNPRPVGPGDTPILLTLLPVNGTFEKKQIVVPVLPELLRIGRQTNAKTTPTPANGFFDSKVLSRSHAEIWADRAGKVWIKDVKSSNGTFVNSTRLSLENRESEPHQLREHDLLELGIDIVSEDQKSIVHHKVSAKVEHAGPVSLSVLDVSFGDIDPASGLAAPFPRNLPQYRGRGNSTGSNGSNRSIAVNGMNGHQFGGFAGPRALHASLNPVTVEQVVRKLNTEILVAKHYNEELDRSHEYLNLLLNQEPGQALPGRPTGPEEISVNSPTQPSQSDARPTTNGMHRVSPLDPMSPYTQPPAPPPSQPLPEKPDASRSAPPEPSKSGLQSLLRAESERPRSGTASQGSSPTRDNTGDIANLVTALRTAQKQIESQSQEVESLKTKLREESTARQLAEVQAKLLLEQQVVDTNTQNHAINGINITPSLPAQAANSDDTASDNSQRPDSSIRLGDSLSPLSTANSSSTTLLTPSSSTDSLRTTTEVDASTSALQNRLEAFTREMDEMKQQMERYRQRAESAEGERSSLLEMIERLRAENERDDGSAVKRRKGNYGKKEWSSANGFTSSDAHPASETIDDGDKGAETLGEHITKSHVSRNGKVPEYKAHEDDDDCEEDEKLDPGDLVQTPLHNTEEETAQEIRDAMATIMKNPGHFRNHRELMGQAGPYASMLGVVLIGVGLMTWLNGWQKAER